MILVTGGAGFIGANFVLDWLRDSDEAVLNVDKLTYAGNLRTLKSLEGETKHVFVRADICDAAALDSLFSVHRPRDSHWRGRIRPRRKPLRRRE